MQFVTHKNGVFLLVLEVRPNKSLLRRIGNISAQTPWDLKGKHFFRNSEGIFIENIELFCGNLRFLEKIGLKLDHFDQKMQVLDQILTLNWFNLIKNVLSFLKICLIRLNIFKNNLFWAKEYKFWWFIKFSLMGNRTKYRQIPSLCIAKKFYPILFSSLYVYYFRSKNSFVHHLPILLFNFEKNSNLYFYSGLYLYTEL